MSTVMRPFECGRVPGEREMVYPRICAHRGFNSAAPENSLPAYGAAVALGAEEIEFDVRCSKDGVLVSCHDGTLERISDGHGKVSDYTYEELRRLDFGSRFSPEFQGLRIPTFEEIVRQFAGRTIMNIHVKIWDDPIGPLHFEEIASILKKYGAEHHSYMMSRTTEVLLEFRKILPEVGLCQGSGVQNPSKMVDIAIENGIEKVQFYVPRFYDPAEVRKAKAHGILVNYCNADTPEEALSALKDGVDTLLTNHYLTISNAVNEAYPGRRYSTGAMK